MRHAAIILCSRGTDRLSFLNLEKLPNAGAYQRRYGEAGEKMQVIRNCYPDPVIEPLPLVPRMVAVALLAVMSWVFPLTAGMILLG